MRQKEVGKTLKRKQTVCSNKCSKTMEGYTMAQAATLDAPQLQRVLDYLKTRRHYRRNRTMVLLTHRDTAGSRADKGR